MYCINTYEFVNQRFFMFQRKVQFLTFLQDSIDNVNFKILKLVSRLNRYLQLSNRNHLHTSLLVHRTFSPSNFIRVLFGVDSSKIQLGLCMEIFGNA